MSGINEKAVLITAGVVIVGFIWYSSTQEKGPIDKERESQLNASMNYELDVLADRLHRWDYHGDHDADGSKAMNIETSLANDDGRDAVDNADKTYEKSKKMYDDMRENYDYSIRVNIIDWYTYENNQGMNQRFF